MGAAINLVKHCTKEEVCEIVSQAIIENGEKMLQYILSQKKACTAVYCLAWWSSRKGATWYENLYFELKGRNV